MNKTIKIIICFCSVLIAFSFSACSKQNTLVYSQYEKISLKASWAYNYGSVRDLAENCDLAAYVKIIEMEAVKDSPIPQTVYTAELLESLFGKEEKSVRIVMTGKIDDNEKKIYEIEDDPLMKPGDEFFVFARGNEDGTYTILSGPQGRFEIIDNMVFSLNNSNEQVAKNNVYSNISVKKQSKDDFFSQVKDCLANR